MQPELATGMPQLHPRIPAWFTTKSRSQGKGEAGSRPAASSPVPSSPFLFSAFISSAFLSSSPVASEAQEEADSSPVASEAHQDIPSDGETKASSPSKREIRTPAKSRMKRQRTEELYLQAPIVLKKKKKARVSHDRPIIFFKSDVQERENATSLRPQESDAELPTVSWKPSLDGKPKIRVPKRGGHRKQPTRLGRIEEARPKSGQPTRQEQRQRLKRLAARRSRAQAAEAMAQHESIKEGGRQVNVVRLPFIPVPRQEWGILPGKIFQRHPVEGKGVIKKQ
ncbi:hypothetical protein MAPG_09154 [Magnaporthiopsis poae ATCC 64411]|uniref:Uncharacterized protein n=1 Tax=Magnaporthiopsis poae (strain ATCC 64411 / 73-15) TaxID=644358 RepID=A0A0C4E975_MAGP6|nr:hypothetical protein MAPG_09154 [Magnaporthiopsis poae ATCC 64411]